MTIRQPLVFFAQLVLCATFASAQWRRVETGSLSWLHAIHFVDEKKGWLGGSNGTLLSTADGGLTWKKEQFPNTDAVRDIVFTSVSDGWLLCERSQFLNDRKSNRSYLMHTVDGGKSWSIVNFQTLVEPRTRIFFGRKGEGYAIGEGGLVAEFSLDARPEKRIGVPSRFLMLDGVVVNGSRIVLVGGGGSIFWTDDKGDSWQPARFSTSRPTAKFNATVFIDDKHGWAVGNDGLIVSSTDGGISWRGQKPDAGANLLDILFCNAEYGFAVGENGIILRTSDSGRSWTVEPSGSKHRLERLAKAGKRLFAVGFGGTVLVREIAAR